MEKAIIIDNTTIKILIDEYKDHTHNGMHYKYVGKGGEGVIYRCNNKIIKIYIRIDIKVVIKEFYVVGILQELNAINDNIINVYHYYLSLSNPVMIMSEMDGNLKDWCEIMIKNKNNEKNNEKELEILWLSMIFQVSYGFLFLNKLKILHSDAKPKNILYIKQNDNAFGQGTIFNEYKNNGTKYRVPTNCLFKIADFGAVQIMGSSLNKMDDIEIQQKIDNRDDLKELSRIIYRILVDYAIKMYDISYIKEKYINNDNMDYTKYYNEETKHINTDIELKKLPSKIKESMLLRSLLYYGIENDIIDKHDIIKKNSLIMPSDTVIFILDRLIDSDQQNIFDLFNSYFKI
jgi:hypothetical protein